MDAPDDGDDGRKKKSGGGAGGSPATHGQFMGDEFRFYMSRKIELQRKQIGLVLPPPPPPRQPPPTAGDGGGDSSAPTVGTSSTPSSSRSNRKRVRFSQKLSSSPCSDDKEEARGGSADGGSLSAVLSRLKERHGQGRSKKRRRRSAKSSGTSFEETMEKRGNASSPSSQKRRTRDEDAARAQQRVPDGPHDVVTTKRSRPDLFFYGVVVLINGYTSPDTPTLTRMLQKHGGDVEKYETSRVTHIIASALSAAKALIYKRQRNPTPYVYPEWVVDSCREGRLLPHADYFIDEIKDDSVGTQTVKSYFTSPTSAASKATSGIPEAGKSTSTTVAGVTKDDLTNSRMFNNFPVRSGDKSLISKEATESSTGRALTYMPSSRPITRTAGTDPDFLTSYFQNSRLSFIGSFQQRVTQKQQRDGDSASSPSRRRRPKAKSERFVFHVDIDCFFAAVVLRKYPEYRSKPVAVGHGWKTDAQGRPVPVGEGDSSAQGDNAQGEKKSYSELSTCNYNAREYGVRKGMFLHQARQLCPSLIVLPYDYDGYEEVSSLVSDVLHQHAEKFDGVVEQVSCDEAYIELCLSRDDVDKDESNKDLSDFVKNVAETIRGDIFAATECTASVGVGANKFLAKLATDKAKPDGSFVVKDCYELLYELKLRDLPGIGRKLDRKLQANRLESVRDVLALGDEAKEKLCSLLGPGNGQKLLDYIDGQDDRPVESAKRKTIGAECNYGVRFDGQYGPDYLIDGLSKEVCKRMEAIGVKGGRKVTLKIMQRRADAAKEPAKFLGHGKCNSLSRTCDMAGSCDDWKPISAAAFALFEGLGIDKDDVRGVGIVLSKLSFFDDDQECTGATKMTSWLQSGGKQSDGVSGKDDSTSTEVIGKGRDISNQAVGSLVASPPRQAIGSDNGSTGEGSPRQKSRSDEKSLGGTGNVSPTQYVVESPQSIRANDDGGYALPSLSQIDEEVLGQMPEDVQASVRRLRSPSDENGVDQRSGQSDNEGVKEAPPVARGNEDSVSLAQPVEEEDEGGWALPPLSQIDEDEVMALPTPLRDEILKEMMSKETRSTTSRRSNSAKSPQRTKSTVHIHHSSIPGDSNLRQMSLKRMMKLASVKNGQDEQNISLSQLDNLPLELQLQIVNNDEGPLRSRRRQTRSNNDKTSARGSPLRKKNGSPHRTQSGPATSNASAAGPLFLIDDEEEDLDIQPSFQVSDLDDADSDFYHTNILPLTNWMNDRPDPSSDDVDRVKDFFVTLLDEKRLDDVTSLLRAIKRRVDIWGRNKYGGLLDTIDDRFIATEGRRLDRSYL